MSEALAISRQYRASDGISPRNFKRLASFIYDETGIKMPESKITMLEGRLRRRVRASGRESIDDYCQHLLEEGGAKGDELVQFINAVTTNKTDFFREPRHFDYLQRTILPDFVAQGRRSIRCWSAACSTGAEPYTIAMVLSAFAEKHGGPDFELLATDIDTDVLDAARRGIYSDDLIAPVSAELRRKYVMEPKDGTRREVRMIPALRRKIAFGRLNLMNERYPIGEPVDMVFCRNVLIYFDKPTQKQVVTRLCANLRSGGHLFVGHSESIVGFDLPFRQVANTVFRKD